MARNITASKRGFGYLPKSKSLGLFVDGVLVENFPATMGRTYYVNNITGSATADGLSWGSAMNLPSVAIAASETYRELGAGAPTVTTNDYVANTILIQGTNTAYTGITDLGERCYIIGVSAGLIRDAGSGQVRIGSSSTYGSDDATNARGNTIYNVQFQAGGDTMYAFRNTAWIQRSRFVEVTFRQVAASLESLFYTSNMSGTILDRCHFTDAGSPPTHVLYGFYAAGSFTDSQITNCTFHGGTTALLYLANSLQTGSVVGPGNMFFATSAVGAQNACTEANYTSNGCALLVGNYFSHKNAAQLTDDINWAITGMVSGNMGQSAIITSG